MWMKCTLSLLFLAAVFNSVYSNGAYVVTWTDDQGKGNAVSWKETPSSSESDSESTEEVTEIPLLGRRQCTYGPAYWCHNITQAKSCGAVKHCISNVWESKTYPQDKDSVCKVCLDMVKQARDQLLSNETQTELKEVLEGSCNLIPLKIVAEGCDQLVDEMLPEFVDMLASRMDPQTVCSVSGLCNSALIDEKLKAIEKPEDTKFDLSVNSCPKCNYFIGQGLSWLQRMSQRELLEKAFVICGHMDSYSDGCRAEVLQNINAIYGHLQKAETFEICGLVGLCQVETLHKVNTGNGMNVAVWSPPSNNDDVGCDFCKQMVQHLRDWIVANTTKEEFLDIIHGLCKQTGGFSNECIHLANEYGAPAYQLLLDGLNPEKDCQWIGICPNGKFKLFDTKAPITTILGKKPAFASLEEGEKLTGDDEKAALTPPMLELLPGERWTGDDEAAALAPKKDKPLCEFCELALHELQNYLQNPGTESSVKEAVDKLCTQILPAELSDQCKEFVSDYADQVIAMLSQEIDPSQVCPALNLCNKEEETNVKDVPTCPLCHYVMGKLMEYIGTNRSKEAIDSAVDRVCLIVPSRMKTKCDNFMKDYGEKIAEMILIDFTTREVCLALRLCVMPVSNGIDVESTTPRKIIIESPLSPNLYMPQILVDDEIQKLREIYSNQKPIVVDPSSVKDSEKCQICEVVMVQLDNMLKDNSTEEEIKEALEKVCHHLPKKWSAQCDEFVESYGDMVLNYLAQSMDPHDVCVEIKLCDKMSKPEPVEVKESSKCVICEYIITELDQVLGNNATEEEIKAEVEAVCKRLPRTVAGNCQRFVETYGEMIIDFLVKDMDPAQICTELGLCEPPKTLLKPIVDNGRKWDKCEICMIVSDYLSLMLKDHEVDDSIEKVVEKVCPLFPNKYQDECKVMIEDYGPYLLSLLAQETDKGQACSMLQLCTEKVH